MNLKSRGFKRLSRTGSDDRLASTVLDDCLASTGLEDRLARTELNYYSVDLVLNPASIASFP